MRLLALTSSPERVPRLRAAGITPLVGNLDVPAQPAPAGRHRDPRAAPGAAAASRGGASWRRDPRTAALLRALRLRSLPTALVYGSTSGVYGDCGGARVDETRAVAPHTPRAHRRVDAERACAGSAAPAGRACGSLRIPGIYAPDREGGTPRERLLKGTPVLRAEDDVYTNHIHADDLARACARGAVARPAAAHFQRQRRQRPARWATTSTWRPTCTACRARRAWRETRRAGDLPLLLLSFMSESRRLDNARLKRELRLRLRYPTVAQGLRS